MTDSVEFVQYETLDDRRVARIWLNPLRIRLKVLSSVELT